MSLNLSGAGKMIWTAKEGSKVTLSSPASIAGDRAISMYDPLFDSDMQFGSKRTSAVAVAKTTLLASESGSVIFVDDTAQTTFTLPALGKGLNYHFVCVKKANVSDVAVTSTGANMSGHLIGGAVQIACLSKTTINFVKNVAEPGDELRLVCNGTIWSASGKGQTTLCFSTA
jgi:hypothetical protein